MFMNFFRFVIFLVIFFLNNLFALSQESYLKERRFVPQLHLKGEFGYTYSKGTVILIDLQNADTVTCTAKVKWRGASSNSVGKHKRNYRIKLTTDQSFLGMRKDKDWILDAGQADVFRLRNRVATELWNDFARKPYYLDREPKVLTGVRGKVVEVFLNDEYRGVYCLTEVVDRKELRLKKNNGNIIHGQLWKSKGYGASLMSGDIPFYDNTSDVWDVFETKYPEFKDGMQADYKPLWRSINFVSKSSDKDFKDSVAYYFDLPVVEDYYIFVQTLNAVDNIGKNLYMGIYDQQTSPMITFSVWDLDLSVGSIYLKNYSEKFISPEYPLENMNLIERLIRTDAAGFREKVRKRYQDARQNILSTDSLIARYRYYYELLKESGAAAREEKKWSGDTDVSGAEINFDKEINYISNWITRRMRYLDAHVFFLPTGLKSITNSNIKENEAYYTLEGIKLNGKPCHKGIYIYKGKKVMLR